MGAPTVVDSRDKGALGAVGTRTKGAAGAAAGEPAACSTFWSKNPS
jgi:hypothetical protein